MSSDSTQLDTTAPLRKLANPTRLAVVAAAVLIVVLVAGVVLGLLSNQGADGARRDYDSQRQRLRAAISEAGTQSYTSKDLAPVTSRLRRIESRKPPLVLIGLADFYQRQLAETTQLEGSLQGLLARVLDDATVTAGGDLDLAKAEIDKDRQLGVDDATVAALQDRYTALTQQRQAAHSLRDLRTVDGTARQLVSDAQATGKAQQQENQVIQQGAQQLIAAKAGDINQIRQIAKNALFAARNETTVAAYMNYGHQFKGDFLQLNIAYQRLEKFGPMTDSPDVGQVALAAAAGQRYETQVKELLSEGMPPKAIVVSYQAQELWAYESGRQVQDTLVTTGRPALPTDLGPMHVLHKDSPWQMKSPWPKESPWYYPPTWVKMVLWFTNTGEGLHDADWEYSGQYGPGGQYGGAASHGCVHVPYDAEAWLFNWGDVGTPIIVYPGDGSPVTNQMKQMTTDDQGVPPNGAGYRGA
jgi:lipoprotein-anchoring transpeptidase ErfK/SrfK